ncbi:MAG TPA: response regulator [Actinomycetota bacterium]|jgi:DNA-binding response OmpR family regulator|nr:response regulator [Actinomycetota bacterium]
MDRILVVEDDPAVRDMLVMILELEGFSVHGVGGGSEAVDALEEAPEPFDLVVLDVMLGGTSGYDVLRHMDQRGQREHTKVLMLTSRASEPDILIGWRHQVDEYQTKPFDASDLVDAVRETLDRSPEELARFREDQLRRAELFSDLEVEDGRSP